MSEKPPDKSKQSDPPENDQTGDTPVPKSPARPSTTKKSREDKLAEALRANLRRRKQAIRKNED